MKHIIGYGLTAIGGVLVGAIAITQVPPNPVVTQNQQAAAELNRISVEVDLSFCANSGGSTNSEECQRFLDKYFPNAE